MEIIKSNSGIYKGKIIEMGKKSGHSAMKEESIEESQNTINEDLKKLVIEAMQEVRKEEMPHAKESGKKITLDLATFILSLLIAFGGGFIYLQERFDSISIDISDCLKEEDIGELRNDVKQIKEDIYNDGGIRTKLRELQSDLKCKVLVVEDDETVSAIAEASVGLRDVHNVGRSITEDTRIGKDSNGDFYTADELINECILLTYEENGKEIFFLGQYNENYNWDGHCITNAYFKDGFLYGICESNFLNGERLDYKSLYVTNSNEWIYTDRICEKDSVTKDTINKGISITYSFLYDKKKNFTNTNVRKEDILDADELLKGVGDKSMLKYYSGNTSGEQYNDTTGDAYEAIYYNDGTIKTLYKGYFINGTFNDSRPVNESGEYAWDIAYSEELGYYVLNEGEFNNGHSVNGSDTEFSLSEIKELIEKHNFKCTLNFRE